MTTAPRPTAAPTPSNDPAAVTVNGEDIGINQWVEAVLVDRAMSSLTGSQPPSAEATLERLINDTLVIQAAPQEPPPTSQVEEYIAALQTGWQVNDAQVTAALQDVGLERQSLLHVISHLLMVQQGQQELEEDGTDITAWLTAQRETAQIVYHQERIDIAMRSMATPPPVPTATPTATSRLPQASDFVLRDTSGTTFTLSQQLTNGPVVLVFFQRCG